jgi:hypothetical protein
MEGRGGRPRAPEAGHLVRRANHSPRVGEHAALGPTMASSSVHEGTKMEVITL